MSKATSRKQCKIRPRVQLITNRNRIRRIQWYHSGRSGVTPNKGYGPPIWRNFLSEVNRARKVKSDAQVATNKNLDPVQKFSSLGVAVDDSATNSNFSKFPELSETSRARKLIFSLQVNIHKASSRRYHVTR